MSVLTVPSSYLLEQIPHALDTAQNLPDLVPFLHDASFYAGKVRDNFSFDKKRILVTSDRISAFDRLLGLIPFKGEILTQIAAFWFEQTKNIAPNHLIAVPDPQVMIAHQAEVIPIECIVRQYLTGSLWRDYQKGTHTAYGLTLPNDLKEFHCFPSPILTPSTKAAYGEHDLPISPSEMIRLGLVTPEEWEQIASISSRLFAAAGAHAHTRGLILVDTKYEFGRIQTAQGDKKLVVIDEIHTPDSSRYWYQEDALERIHQAQAPRALDKEFLRNWLLKNGFSGNGDAPFIPDEIRAELAQRYLELYEVLIGKPFTLHPGPVLPRVAKNLNSYQAGAVLST